MEVEGAFNGQEQVLYNQGGIRLILTADNLIQLIEPYNSGTSTYSVREDKTAIQTLHVGQQYDYTVYFANQNTDRVEYSAHINEFAFEQYEAEFRDTNDQYMDSEGVVVTYDPEGFGSRNSGFTNLHGQGTNSITIPEPALYPNISQTMTRMEKLLVQEW